ncbi:unnamed protein product [Brachionus calyciflorus]|uniref:Uncharacterized protein n=1 Tax=Brachionus calyciflorus TaxID=104777 RepID=A0A813PH00_9BILA|nr:unnamed protein product [Brachionus calyciflorus]
MFNFNWKLIEYYDDLKNQIDDQYEKKLLKLKLSESDEEDLEIIRDDLIEKTDECLVLSLDKLKFINQNENSNIFDYLDRFCFFIRDDKSENLFGFLVITNRYIDHNARLILQSKYTDFKENLEEIDEKDFTLGEFLNIWINQHKINDQDCIIELPKSHESFIDFLNLNFAKNHYLNEDDFDFLEGFMLSKNIKQTILYFNQIEIESNAFKGFNQLEKLLVKFKKSFILNYNCFNGLNNLKELAIFDLTNTSVIEILKPNILKTLPKLEFLFIQGGMLKVLNCEISQNNPYLKYLKLNFCVMEKIEPDCFDYLPSLKFLNLSSNSINYFPEDLTTKLKNLVFLDLSNAFEKVSIDTTWFNQLESLEFLDISYDFFNPSTFLNMDSLNIPRLKYLGITSLNEVPKFDLNLQILKIQGIKELPEDSLDKLTCLKCLILEPIFGSIFGEIRRNRFQYMRNLTFFQVKIEYDELAKPIDEIYDDDMKEIYAKFLSKPNVKCTINNERNFIQVSCYDTLELFLNEEIKFENITTEEFLKFANENIEWIEN